MQDVTTVGGDIAQHSSDGGSVGYKSVIPMAGRRNASGRRTANPSPHAIALIGHTTHALLDSDLDSLEDYGEELQNTQGITGLMLYHDTQVFTCMEGSAAAVQRACGLMLIHHLLSGMIELCEGGITQRAFGAFYVVTDQRHRPAPAARVQRIALSEMNAALTNPARSEHVYLAKNYLDMFGIADGAGTV